MDFEMIGKLRLSKETDNFHPYTEQKFDSGWVRRRLIFNALCGDNRHSLTIEGGCYADGHGDVYVFSKGSTDDDGNRIKGESFTIPFKDRLKSKRLDEVAEFRKFVVDLEKPNRRYKLERAVEKLTKGTSLTDEELKELDLENESEVTKALEKSKKKRHEFISEWDFAEFIKKVIDSGKYDNQKFRIIGNGEYTYSEKNERIYTNYVPKRIYLAEETAEEKSEATIKIVYNSGGLDDLSVEDKGKYFVNGYMMEYDRNRKSNIPVPVTLVILAAGNNATEKEHKVIEALKRKFTVDDDSWKEYGVVVKMLDGSQRMQLTEDMLTDEQREDLELGLITKEDIISDLGGSVYGERIREYQFARIARGYTSGRVDTVYTDENMIIKPIVKENEVDVEDIFNDDDDEL